MKSLRLRLNRPGGQHLACYPSSGGHSVGIHDWRCLCKKHIAETPYGDFEKKVPGMVQRASNADRISASLLPWE